VDFRNILYSTPEAFVIRSGSLLVSTGTSSLTGNVSFDSSNVYMNVSGAQLTLSGLLSGTGGFSKRGSGLLVLNHQNTYSGATLVNGGTLVLGADGALGTTAGGTTVGAGASLDFQNVNYLTPETLTMTVWQDRPHRRVPVRLRAVFRLGSEGRR